MGTGFWGFGRTGFLVFWGTGFEPVPQKIKKKSVKQEGRREPGFPSKIDLFFIWKHK